MAKVEYKDLLDAGVHFGHLTRKWNPNMAPYIFMEKNGIHIIDLNKTLTAIDEACSMLKGIVRSGRKILFVATKKQAKTILEEHAQKLNMPYVSERWLGGMLTNFSTIRKSLKKMASIDKLMKDEAYQNMAKRERLMKSREKAKLEKVLGGISDLTRLPAAIFVIDVKKEHIAVAEANKLNIPVIAMIDTNSDPQLVDFPIPANDDAFKSIELVVSIISKAVGEGLDERRKEREEAKMKEEENAKKEAEKIEAEKKEQVAEAVPEDQVK